MWLDYIVYYMYLYTLQDSLGGSARTVVIATLNSAAACQEESTTTLAFAQRCARVTAKLQSCEVSGNAFLLVVTLLINTFYSHMCDAVVVELLYCVL
jgi:Kinesin motor domain